MKLSLYYPPDRDRSRSVLAAAQAAGLDLTLLDVSRNSDLHRELVSARGHAALPVLRIEARGRVERIGEARAIIEFLRGVAAVRHGTA